MEIKVDTIQDELKITEHTAALEIFASLEKHSNLTICAIYLPIILSVVVGFYLSHHAMDKMQDRYTWLRLRQSPVWITMHGTNKAHA